MTAEVVERDDSVPADTAQIAREQIGAAEQNVAKLLHDGGLAETLLQEQSFHLSVENSPYLPLVVERHGGQLYLTHYLETDGELALDAEMVFNIKAEGQLTLSETAVQDPINGGETRSLSRAFGKLFSGNLLEQGFGDAIAQTLNQSAVVAAQPEAPAIEPLSLQNAQGIEAVAQFRPEPTQTLSGAEQIQEKLQRWPSIVKALSNNTVYHGWVKVMAADHKNAQTLPSGVSERLEKDLAAHATKLNQLKDWHQTATSLGKPENYLNRIIEVTEGCKVGRPVSTEAAAAMSADFNKADWIRLSENLQGETPQQLSMMVAVQALQENKPHRDILVILESDPSFQALKTTQGLPVAQDYRKRALVEALKQVKVTREPALTSAQREVNHAFLSEARRVLDNLYPNDLPGTRYWEHHRYTITESQDTLSVFIAQTNVTVQKVGDSITGYATAADVDVLKRANVAMAAIEVQPKRLKGIGIGE